ncbi:helix-turn-helix transcriptional regulator [Rhodococcus ruber]|uniref:helix-turn-helix transcriptional regulator n=1 Tax=Rhodococcus ruber TaxID=1830 RepID=UPI001785EEA2|nr:helix-turn-helix transcriptional regulator [Rhodococcus ruber]MBD8057071.1 helix-turn-helix transcriptional regulator [Rhodococcus ruber]
MPRRALHGFDPARLIEVRHERGLSRSDLGRLAGVSYNTIRGWETGRAAPSPAALEQVAQVLQVDASELVAVRSDARTLAFCRTQKGLAQEDVARELGMSKSTYSRLERGERPMTNAEAQKLAAVLGIDEEQVKSLWLHAHRRPAGPRL